jgi:hypothetical protein
MAIVNNDGTPTVFFFRWLMSGRATGLAAADTEILETFDAGDGALESANPEDTAASLASSGEYAAAAAGLAEDAEALAFTQALDAPGARADERSAAEQRFYEAMLATDAPAAAAAPVTRDLIANIPTGLNEGDAGLKFYATDYQHVYRWTGAGWSYDDTDAGSGFIQWFLVAPRKGLWQLCNGASPVTESTATGTTALVNFPGLPVGQMPNLAGANAYLRGAPAANGVVNGPTMPTLVSSRTGMTDLIQQQNTTGGGNTYTINTDALNPHDHSIPGFATAGEPAHIDAMPYYRL